jgi:hypothetical protein
MKPATRIKNNILETRHPALAKHLKPNIPAIMDKTKNTIAKVNNIGGIIILSLDYFSNYKENCYFKIFF